jgi:hypothetical protein
MTVEIVSKIREFLRKLEEKFKGGERSGRVLTLLAILRLSRRGEKITPETVTKEAHEIMRETPSIDWGVPEDAYTIELAGSLLKEFARLGIIEEVEGGYIIRCYQRFDPASEIYARFGHLIFYGGPSR